MIMVPHTVYRTVLWLSDSALGLMARGVTAWNELVTTVMFDLRVVTQLKNGIYINLCEYNKMTPN
jgi:hypothetical protein